MDFGAQSIDEFLDAIASETVAPASGSAVATTGAMGAALCEMACVHTLGNDPEEVPIDLEGLRDRLRTKRGQLLRLAGQDTQVIETVFAATSADPTPADTDRLVGIPVSIAEAGLAVIEMGSTVVDGVDRTVVADARAGLLLADASFEGALWLVRNNLDRVSDAARVEQTEERVADLVETRTGIDADLADSVRSDQPGSGVP